MKKLDSRIMVFIIVIFILTTFVGCSKENKSQKTFSIEQFENAMKDKGYNFEIEDAQQDFLPTTRKRMIIDDKTIDIYLFKNEKKMENEAKNISNDGCGYNNGSKVIQVSWVSFPHFYKRGNLIVQYVGENEIIMSELKDILGEPFAGYTP